MMEPLIFAGLGLFLTACYLLQRILRPARYRPLPPGPRQLPLIGNALDLPKSHEWYTYHEWAKQYGDVIYLSVLGKPVIILNSHEAAVDLLIKKAAIYSDRPTSTMGGKIVGWEDSIALVPYHRQFKTMRRWFGLLMGTRSSTHLWDVEEQMTKRFIRKVYNGVMGGDREGLKVEEKIRWTAGAIILRITYGYAVAEKDDPFIQLAGNAMESFSQSMEPGVWAVDFFPILRHLPSWFPLAHFKRIGKKWRALIDDVGKTPLDFVKNQIMQGTAPLSFVRDLLEERGPEMTPADESLIQWAAVGVYTGGADTTVSAIYSFFLAMTSHPEIQKRAQSELDHVLCNERLPTLQDRQNGLFPYIDALAKEIVRWAPVVPAGLPHALREEDEYRGWRIPKGSQIYANIWGITRNATMYPSPHEFRPERFLTKAQGGDCETENDLPLDPTKIIFGYGKRSCPGQHLAELSIWISIAMSLAVYNISAIKGHEPSVYDCERGVVAHPKPFKCEISVRSTKAEELIKAIPDHDVTAWMHPLPKKQTTKE
ncbi:cytochrome P450 [Sistotremastrum niveocremeum HHB9708]|uniref:Cytochrome P450 n=1 Tax=Sistotremastrum niveocremeum HHB9708 TaxID=1314777 RepID=A0A164S1S6_9AGAM|nr:cytochrome P450 [Sistotremastrum niveocremeum HHB9708]